MITTYTVEGMTCGHCVQSVTEEMSAISGVGSVKVDLAAKQVSVESREPLNIDDVRAAVTEAGYTLVEA